MAINNNVQNVKFLRNAALFDTREEAIAALNTNKSLGLDGSAILARYSGATATDVKTLVGFIWNSGEDYTVTIFDIEGASADVEALRTEINNKLGTGVTSANTATAQFAALSGNNESTSAETSVEGAKRYADDLISTLDYDDTAVNGSYVSQVTEVDGVIAVQRVALPDASSVSGESKVVVDVTQDKGQITATAANLTGVKLDGYEEAAATGNVASTDTLGEALGKLQKTIHEMDKNADAVAGQVVTTVSEADGVVSETKANVKDLQLVGYVKDTTATGDVASTDTINAALSKLENKAAAITIDNEDGSITVTTGASGTDIELHIKTGEHVLAVDANGDGVYTDIKLSSVTPSSTAVKEEYALVGTDGSVLGDKVKIYKDSHIVSITYITDSGDTHYQNLKYVYIDDSGNTQTEYVDISSLVLEAEFASGVTITDHVAHGVVDPTSEKDSQTTPVSFLTVGADGFKVSGIKDEIDRKIGALDVTGDTAVAGQYVSAIEETDGIVAVKTRANVSEAVLNNYTKGTDATAVASTDTVNQAISKLENQVDAVDGLVDGLSAKTFTVATSSNASIATTVTAAADGTKSVDLITDADKIKMSGFTSTGESLSAITTDDSIATAFEKAEAAIDAAKAASSTVVAEGTDAGDNMTITSSTDPDDGHVTYTINLSDVASASALTDEISHRKTVDGIDGDAYTANSNTNYISTATSLNNADVLLDAAIDGIADNYVSAATMNGSGVTKSDNTLAFTATASASAGTASVTNAAIAIDTDANGGLTFALDTLDCGTY